MAICTSVPGKKPVFSKKPLDYYAASYPTLGLEVLEMRIKEAAKLTGLTERTIRYYESVGLVIPHIEERNWRQWRDYSPEHVRLLSAIATLRRASFRVEEISRLLTEPEKIPETVEVVRERAEKAMDELEEAFLYEGNRTKALALMEEIKGCLISLLM